VSCAARRAGAAMNLATRIALAIVGAAVVLFLVAVILLAA
jgi:hypothetical protein